MTSSPPTIRIRSSAEHSVIELTGRWILVTNAAERGRIIRELDALDKPAEHTWDLRGIEGLDSLGALLLWRTWGRRYPAQLRSYASQRYYFERFAARDQDQPQPEGVGLRRPLTRLGATITEATGHVAELLLLLGHVIVAGLYVLRHPRFMPWKELSATIYKAGCRSVPLIGILSLLIGMVMGYQMGMAISRYGANTAIIGIVSLAILRELSPWITAIILAGRTGSAITAEVGSMHLTGELHALRTLGISPILRLAFPRVLGLAIALPLLVLWADLTGSPAAWSWQMLRLASPPSSLSSGFRKRWIWSTSGLGSSRASLTA